MPLGEIMKKKYWPGNKRMISDIFWCLLMAVFFFKQDFLFTGMFTGVFMGLKLVATFLSRYFLFFFWSWNKEHLKDRAARNFIHIMVASYLSLVIVMILTVTGLFWLEFSVRYLWTLAIMLLFAAGILERYRKIMKDTEQVTTS